MRKFVYLFLLLVSFPAASFSQEEPYAQLVSRYEYDKRAPLEVKQASMIKRAGGVGMGGVSPEAPGRAGVAPLNGRGRGATSARAHDTCIGSAGTSLSCAAFTGPKWRPVRAPSRCRTCSSSVYNSLGDWNR